MTGAHAEEVIWSAPGMPDLLRECKVSCPGYIQYLGQGES